jgi:hypothetical protein
MRCRRLFALLTSVTMLHLSVVAGDAACVMHRANGHHALSPSGVAIAEHAMPTDGHVMPVAAATEEERSAAPVADSDTSPCEIPAQQRCCGALIGCSVATAVTSAHEALATIVLPAARVRVALHDAPASFASAPEPPPPKA